MSKDWAWLPRSGIWKVPLALPYSLAVPVCVSPLKVTAQPAPGVKFPIDQPTVPPGPAGEVAMSSLLQASAGEDRRANEMTATNPTLALSLMLRLLYQATAVPIDRSLYHLARFRLPFLRTTTFCGFETAASQAAVAPTRAR